jgi:glycine/D-amino acid oxidase-like deaminating enzyme
MTLAKFDVAIIGAGIVGAACALECVRAGMSVVVIEARITGGGATAAGMGHLVVMDDSEAQFALTRFSRDLWHEVADTLPRECEFETTGTIWVATDDEELQEVQRKYNFYRECGVRVQVLDAKALNEAEPNLRPGLEGGLLVPDDAVLYPPCSARYLLKEAERIGGSNRFKLAHGKLAVSVDEAGVVLDDGSTVSTGVTVNAAGSLSPLLSPGLNVQPRKGHLVITDRYPGFLRHQLIELGYLKSAHSSTVDSVAFNIQPRQTGQLLIGSSRQYSGTSPEVEPGILRRMILRACEYMPGLKELLAIRVWTGFRAATPDKLPLIGPCNGSKRIFLATGHEGLGITTSLGTARLLVDQLLNRASAIPVEPYLPSRFELAAEKELHV